MDLGMEMFAPCNFFSCLSSSSTLKHIDLLVKVPHYVVVPFIFVRWLRRLSWERFDGSQFCYPILQTQQCAEGSFSQHLAKMSEAELHLEQEWVWNNNPSSIQFQERLLSQCFVSRLLCHAACIWAEYLDSMSSFLSARVHLFHNVCRGGDAGGC